MANYNRVILMGNLTRDPQLSYLPSQTPVVELGLAVNRKWKGQDGQQREETCFVDCKAFGKQAEVMNQYLSKGRPVLIEGRLQFSAWEDKEGNKRSKLRVVVENFQFIGGGQGGGGQYSPGQSRQQQAPASQAPASQAPASQAPANQAPASQGQANQAPPAMPSDEPVYDDFNQGGDEIPF